LDDTLESLLPKTDTIAATDRMFDRMFDRMSQIREPILANQPLEE
jgi:hypothetical protein